MANGIGHEVGELHVDHLVGRERCRRGGPPCRGRAPRRCRRRTARRPRGATARRCHPAQVGGQRADRRDDLERVAVGLDDDGVGVLGEQRAEVPEVGGRLEQPPVGHVPGLQVLEVAAVPAVGGGQVGLVEQPAVVGGHLVLVGKIMRAEVAAGDAHALLGEPGAHRVEGGEARDDEVGHVGAGLAPRRCADRCRRWRCAGGGQGRSTSQVSGARLAGSWASRS